MQHYKLAKAVRKPLIIHVRDAHDEMLALLESLVEADGEIRGVVHCFTGNWAQAQRYLACGLHLGFTGVITFPPKKTDPIPQEELIEVVKQIPIDRMLVETDAPYLSPQPYRGKRNEPAFVAAVVDGVAKIREVTPTEIAQQTMKNTTALFGISSQQ